MEQNDKRKSVTVEVTADQHAALEFIASQMDEGNRHGVLNVREQLSLHHLHSLLWRIRETIVED